MNRAINALLYFGLPTLAKELGLITMAAACLWAVALGAVALA